LGDCQEGAYGETFQIKGIECQFAHTAIAAWEKEVASILDEFNVPSPILKMLNGTLIGIPLSSEALTQQWNASAANYPNGLAQAIGYCFSKGEAGMETPSLAA
jgi:hypothetical protein